MDVLFSPTVLAVVVAVFVAVAALVLGRFTKGKEDLVEKITKYARLAVDAVEKLADNGKFDSLTPAERHSQKKREALEFVRTALKEDFGIEPNQVTMYLVDIIIEAVLKQLERTEK